MTKKSDMEKLVRMNVRNLFCGLTESECHEAIAREYQLVSFMDPKTLGHFKIKAMIEWCCEGDFWESNNQLEERTKK